ncbi:MAG TPA: class I SAM-dependent methyltransferase [Pseudonocardiaceae bacterium]|jgi:cyclopropane-fatty-acyl-phospholipid synthase|nr:class I SAM-dependent methyltransferase [Pseudonocardiaceae bacterium]
MSANSAATTTRAAVVATNRHYDLPPEVFATFLGERMKYTCGLYQETTAGLDQAQEAKLRFIAECLGIRSGQRVLDIGVGWGSLAFFLAQEHGCEVVGVTPSAMQARFVREQARARGCAERVVVREVSVYDLEPPAGEFDAVAMVGVIEHMPDHHKALDIAARALRRDGRLYVSASCYRGRRQQMEYEGRASSRHVAETIFGYASLRPVSDLVAAIEDTGLSLSGLTDLTSHYHQTIEAWLGGVRASRTCIDALVPGLSAELVRYLETTNSAWGYTAKHYALTAIRSRWGRTEVPA